MPTWPFVIRYTKSRMSALSPSSPPVLPTVRQKTLNYLTVGSMVDLGNSLEDIVKLRFVQEETKVRYPGGRKKRNGVGWRVVMPLVRLP